MKNLRCKKLILSIAIAIAAGAFLFSGMSLAAQHVAIVQIAINYTIYPNVNT